MPIWTRFRCCFVNGFIIVSGTINHELLITKLNAYGFSTDTLEILLSYLQDRWQRVKVNITFSSWTQLLQGVRQGSVLGLILFNIYINDMFFALKGIDICNFEDDTTPYICDWNLKAVLQTYYAQFWVCICLVWNELH